MAILTLSAFGAAHAGDLPRLQSYGFSPDGKYHLSVSAYRQDGSGFGQARLEVRDTGGKLLESEELEDRSAEAMPEMLASMLVNRSQDMLARYRLQRPVAGEPLWLRPVPLPSLELWPEAHSGEIELPRGRGPNIAWEAAAVSGEGCEWKEMLQGPVRRLSITVGGESWNTVQPEGDLECAAAYAVEGVWRYGPYLAVLVRAYVPGFEGPDALPVFVIGRVP